MNEYLEIVLRTLLAIAVLLLLTRLNGPKQISQLTFYDYIAGITSGSIAATLCVNRSINVWFAVIGITMMLLSSFVMSVLTSKSMFLRRVLTGKPEFLIAQGKIMYDGLKRVHFDVNDLLRELRVMGYFDVSEVNYAIMETNGNVSVMPKSACRPAKANEQGLSLPEDGLSANVVIDGKLMPGNIDAMGKTEKWVAEELQRQKAGPLEEVALATLDGKGKLKAYRKEAHGVCRTALQ